MNPIVAANCPSLQQLMGITDVTDPCQNGTAATTGDNTITPTPASAGFNLSGINPWMIVLGIVILAAATHKGR